MCLRLRKGGVFLFRFWLWHNLCASAFFVTYLEFSELLRSLVGAFSIRNHRMASKALLLEGSCHRQAVKFHVQSNTPHPFMTCYNRSRSCSSSNLSLSFEMGHACPQASYLQTYSICRKLQEGQGGAINIMGDAKSSRWTMVLSHSAFTE